MIKAYLPDVNVSGVASSVSEGLELIRKEKPEVILLDIHISGGSGFDILDQLNDVQPHVIFTTGYEQYAARAFRYAAIDYLTKPISLPELQSAFGRIPVSPENQELHLATLKANLNSNEIRLIIPSGEFVSVVSVKEVLYIKSSKSYSLIYTEDGRCLVSTQPLTYYEDLLEELGFARTHRSCIVNCAKVKRIFTTPPLRIELPGNQNVPLAFRRKKNLMSLLRQHNAAID